MLQADSILTTTGAGEELEVTQHHGPLTPAQVISWLPKTATPAQQDSAVQSRFKPVIVEPSQRPDTLHMPGIPFNKTYSDTLSMPLEKYSVFKDSPFFSTEVGVEEPGVPGDSIPYSIAGDNMMSSALIVCFIVAALALRNAQQLLIGQLKSFFFPQRIGTTEVTETASEKRHQLVLTAVTCVMFAMFFFFYLRDKIEGIFTMDQHVVISILVAMMIGYFVMKYILYNILDTIFFEKKKSQQWGRSRTFLVIIEGMFLLPIIYIQAFFDSDVSLTIICTIIILFLCKLLSFYKSYLIFFAQKGQILQNILYFCMLELSPMSLIWGVMMIISGYLKVKY